jgi:hypothetical protein
MLSKDNFMPGKKIPLYGIPLYNLQKKGERPTNSIYLFIGQNARKKGEAFKISQPTRLLVLPPYLSPFDFRWPVDQCSVIIFDSGYPDEEYIKDTVHCLYEAGATKVIYSSPEGKTTIFDKE